VVVGRVGVDSVLVDVVVEVKVVPEAVVAVLDEVVAVVTYGGAVVVDDTLS
jgi:hypothetical protein